MEDESSMESIYVLSPEGESGTPLPYPQGRTDVSANLEKKPPGIQSFTYENIVIFLQSSCCCFCCCCCLRVHGFRIFFLKPQFQEASDYMGNSAINVS